MVSFFPDLPEWLDALCAEPDLDRLEIELLVEGMTVLPAADQAIIMYVVNRLAGEPAPHYEMHAIRTDDGITGTVHYTWGDVERHAGRTAQVRRPSPVPTSAHIPEDDRARILGTPAE